MKVFECLCQLNHHPIQHFIVYHKVFLNQLSRCKSFLIERFYYIYSIFNSTNEPPTGMQANLHKALDLFNQDTLEMCAKETEFKSILFALCYFHAVVAER